MVKSVMFIQSIIFVALIGVVNVTRRFLASDLDQPQAPRVPGTAR